MFYSSRVTFLSFFCVQGALKFPLNLLKISLKYHPHPYDQHLNNKEYNPPLVVNSICSELNLVTEQIPLSGIRKADHASMAPAVFSALPAPPRAAFLASRANPKVCVSETHPTR
jgi:hypothetical protein